MPRKTGAVRLPERRAERASTINVPTLREMRETIEALYPRIEVRDTIASYLTEQTIEAMR